MNEQIHLAWLAGLQLAIGWAHMLRFAVFDDPPARQKVAVAALFLYGTASSLLLWGAAGDLGAAWAGATIAIVGPVGGYTIVRLTGNQIDAFQMVLGVLQAMAAFGAAHWMLIKLF